MTYIAKIESVNRTEGEVTLVVELPLWDKLMEHVSEWDGRIHTHGYVLGEYTIGCYRITIPAWQLHRFAACTLTEQVEYWLMYFSREEVEVQR